MDEINPTFPEVDVTLVIGARDLINPAARHRLAVSDAKASVGEILAAVKEL